MKPIKLTMQAFGPFAKTEVIDFEKLGRNPLSVGWSCQFISNQPVDGGVHADMIQRF